MGDDGGDDGGFGLEEMKAKAGKLTQAVADATAAADDKDTEEVLNEFSFLTGDGVDGARKADDKGKKSRALLGTFLLYRRYGTGTWQVKYRRYRYSVLIFKSTGGTVPVLGTGTFSFLKKIHLVNNGYFRFIPQNDQAYFLLYM